MKKRLFSFSMLLLCSLLSFAQFSGSGSGTETDPYQVTNAIQLSQLSNFLGQSDVVFQLQNDLYLTDWIAENNPRQGWSPIGVSASPFKGVFLGGSHKISGLSINRASETYTGLFGCLSGARISDLTIEVASVSGGTYVGALAGSATNGSTFTNCQVIQHGTLTSSNGKYIGGFVGLSTGDNVFTSCKFEGILSGDSYIGGLIATIESGNATFATCAVKGDISATGNYVGGLIGACTGIAIEAMTDCYFDGNITGASYVGGLVGILSALTASAPTLHTYQVRKSPNLGNDFTPTISNTVLVSTFNETIKDGTITEKTIKNCAIKGSIEGDNYVGGAIGYQNSKLTYSYDKNEIWYSGSQYGAKYVLFIDGRTSATEGFSSVWDYYRTYYRNTLTLSLSDCSFVGSVNGTESVGGLVGFKSGGSVLRSYTMASIEGQSNVGGIIGTLSQGDSNSTTTVQSNVAINDLVSASQANVGRIYGIADAAYAAIGAVGSNNGNRALATTTLTESGVEKLADDNLQNGSSTGAAMLKMKDNYVAWGWDFDSDWNIQDGESYPYKKFQAAPPTIDSELVYRSTEISGRSADGGVVYLSYNGNEAVAIACEGATWSQAISPLKGGTIVTAYAVVDGKMPSYTIQAAVPEAEYVILDENSVFAPEASEDLVDVRLNRTIKGGEWSTIVLPFAATGEQVKAAFGEDVELAAFTAWESEEDEDGAIVGINVSFATATDITANTPMLIKTAGDITTAPFDGVTIEPEAEPMVQVGRKASERGYFHGTYIPAKVPAENLFLSGNKFWYSTGKTNIKGYRGYFEFRDVLDAYYDAAAVKVNLFIDGAATHIDQMVNGQSVNGKWYDLSGRQMVNGKWSNGQIRKGVYIVNGKKVTLK